MKPTTFSLEIAKGVATITLDRPKRLNALTFEIYRELAETFEQLDSHDEVRAVVITGRGRGFCSGGDQDDIIKHLLGQSTPELVAFTRATGRLIAAMRRCRRPIVGAINGVAAGAGASLAFACDLLVAAEGASFVLAFGRIGLLPDSGATWTLPRLVGLPKALAMALLNEPVSAEEAERLGIVVQVVPVDGLSAAALDLSRRLADAAPIGVALTKRALNAAFERPLEAALEEEAAFQDVAGRTKDHREGMAAFIEKRQPVFRGE